MKKINRCRVGLLCGALLLSLTVPAAFGQRIATNVSWYTYPCALPDTSVPEFGTARDNLLTGMSFGGALDTHSRVISPSGVEIRTSFDSSDLAISTNHFWRGNFDPPEPNASQYGSRVYCPVLMIGNGKVSLSRMSYKVTCGVALLGNNSALSGLDYSVSRIGIQAGSDGALFTGDDIIIKSGSGTNLVDAIVFIGGRVGAVVNQASDFGPLDTEIGPTGTFITYTYYFNSPVGTLSGGTTVSLFPRGLIPSSVNHLTPFIGPKGVLYSLVGPPDLPRLTIEQAHFVVGPWSTVTTLAMEGTSVFMPFNGTAHGDYGFLRLPHYGKVP